MKTEQQKEKVIKAQRLMALIFVFLIAASLIGFYFSPVAASLMKGDRISVLLFGIDVAEQSNHSDTLMMTVLDPMMGRFQFLSIPRDTRVKIPGFRFHRVNEIYGYHMRENKNQEIAAHKIMEAVQFMLSTEAEPIPLSYYVQVDFGGFRKIIDMLGGIWVEVKTPMNYDDKAGNLHVHFQPGRYLMMGDDALRYVRFRGSTGDRGRILRQQEFLRLVAMRMANPINLIRFPKLFMTVISSVRTNLSFWDIIYFTIASKKVRPARIGFYILPGTPKGVLWFMNKDAAHNLAASLVLGEELKEPKVPMVMPHQGLITVEVWNASGRKGVAYQITKFLRDKGFDVVDYGNYPIEQIPTRVVDRTGKIYQAQTVAEALGVQHYHSEPEEESMVDVEVIIGKNYNDLGVAQ